MLIKMTEMMLQAPFLQLYGHQDFSESQMITGRIYHLGNINIYLQ